MEIENGREKTVCFAGHREVYQSGVYEKVRSFVAELAQQGSTIFLNGGMGEFDGICGRAVRAVKKEVPFIRLYLIIPYMSQAINAQKDYLFEMYDEIILPECADVAHYKSSITLRNRWMVEQSGTMLAYVGRKFGGAYEMMRYAQAYGGIKIVNLYEK